MKQFFSALILIMVLSLTAFMLPSHAQANPARGYAWQGLINNKIPVTLWFEIANDLLVGEITYTKTGANKPIRLLGRVQGTALEPEILLHEFLPSGQITGIIHGKVTDQIFMGTWTAPDTIMEKNGQFQTSAGQEYSIVLKAQDPPGPSNLWQFDPSLMASTYKYNYGDYARSGDVEITIDSHGWVNFSIEAFSNAPAMNMCHIPWNAPEGHKERGQLQNNRLFHEVDEQCALELIFYHDFLVVNTLPQKNCSGFCGLGAYIDGIYLKTQINSPSPAPSTKNTGVQLIPILVDKDKVRLRSLPGLDASTKTLVQEGTLLLAEKSMIQEEQDSNWYKVVGIIDNKTGVISSRLSLGQFMPAYVSSALVQEISWATTGFEESFIFEQWNQGAYGQGYGLVHNTLNDQQPLDGKNPLVASCFFKDDSGQGLIPIYKNPSTSGELVNTEVTWEDVRANYFAVDLLALDQSDQDWVLVIDQQATLPGGWIQGTLVEVINFEDHRAIGQRVALDLGAHIPEIMHRWGPGEIITRQSEHSWRGPQDKAKLSFNGLELDYEDYRNFKLTLTRKNAGLGGIFIDTPWCNQDYIENIFGSEVEINKRTQEGRKLWSFSGNLDGWTWEIDLEFNDQGLVQKFKYAAMDINLGH